MQLLGLKNCTYLQRKPYGYGTKRQNIYKLMATIKQRINAFNMHMILQNDNWTLITLIMLKASTISATCCERWGN